MKQIALDIGVPFGPRLENFLAGRNEEALQHLRLWVQGSTRAPVPTYLWGPGGSGKSHLLKAVRTALTEKGVATGWLSADSGVALAFDPGWEAVLMDDVHVYSVDQQQQAFRWFIEAQSPAQGPARWVLAAGDCAPAQLPLRADLRTRLGWGHVFGLHVLDENERRAVLRRVADQRGIFLGDEVMDFLLRRFSRDLGSLLILLDRIDVYALEAKRGVTIPLIRSMLETE